MVAAEPRRAGELVPPAARPLASGRSASASGDGAARLAPGRRGPAAPGSLSLARGGNPPLPGAAPLEQAPPPAYSLAWRSRSALAITVTELKLIAALAIIGERTIPVSGKSSPAASGTPAAL